MVTVSLVWGPILVAGRPSVLPKPTRHTSSRILFAITSQVHQGRYHCHLHIASAHSRYYSVFRSVESPIRPRPHVVTYQMGQKAVFDVQQSRDASTSNDPAIQEELLMLRRMILSVQSQDELSSTSSRFASPIGRTAAAGADKGQCSMPSGNLALYLREASTQKLYGYLVRSRRDTTMAIDNRHAMAASMPPNMFSELLRCLDPFAVSEHCDNAPATTITSGMAAITPLGEALTIFGIRHVYRRLFVSLMAIANLRVQIGHELMIHDYTVLIRSAAAASDWFTAKEIWQDMVLSGYNQWVQSSMYYELIRARFLTENLFAQHDLTKLRVHPLELHQIKASFTNHGQRHRLENLEASLLRKPMLRHGQNIHRYDYAEHMTHILRLERPLHSVLSKARNMGHVRDERTLAAILVALARTGSVKTMDSILAAHWQVSVSWDMETGNVDVSGGIDFPLNSPIRPSTVLLDGIAHAYCTSGNVIAALKLVEYLSRRYGIAIPDRIWSYLLRWSYCMSSKPASTEWRLSKLPYRALSQEAPEAVFHAMTGAGVHPGFDEYNILIKSLIAQKLYGEALRRMRQVKPMYQTQLRRYEEALYEFEEMGKRGVAARRLHRVTNRKWHMWHCIHTWCRLILRRVHARTAVDPVVACMVPDILDEFRPFVLSNTRYSTKSGQVRIREPHIQYQKETLSQQNVIFPSVKYDFREQTQQASQQNRATHTGETDLGGNDGTGGHDLDIGDEIEKLETDGRQWSDTDMRKSSPISLTGQKTNRLYRSRMRTVHRHKISSWQPDLRCEKPRARKWLIQEFA